MKHETIGNHMQPPYQPEHSTSVLSYYMVTCQSPHSRHRKWLKGRVTRHALITAYTLQTFTSCTIPQVWGTQLLCLLQKSLNRSKAYYAVSFIPLDPQLELVCGKDLLSHTFSHCLLTQDNFGYVNLELWLSPKR